MSVIDISQRKWDNENDPAKLSPRDALMAALREIESDPAAHVFVGIARSHDDGGASTSWMQAGSYDLHGQIGLIERIKFDLIDACRN